MFKIHCGIEDVDRKSLQGLWQRRKQSEKAFHDKELLNLYKATRTTGGGQGPSQLGLADPDELGQELGIGAQIEIPSLSLSQNSPLLTSWNDTHRSRDILHTPGTSSAGAPSDMVEVRVPISESGENIFVGAIATTDVVGNGEQEMEGDNSNGNLPDPEANTDAPNLGVGDNDVNPPESSMAPTAPNTTVTERPTRAPKRPNADAKAHAYVNAVDYARSYWTQKLELDKELHNAQMRVAKRQMEYYSMKIEEQKLSLELMQNKACQARQESDYH